MSANLSVLYYIKTVDIGYNVTPFVGILMK